MRTRRLHLVCLQLIMGMVASLSGVWGSETTGAVADRTGTRMQLLEVHAHRGGAGLAPENTLAAFRKALELGVDALEMDLHVTRDGVVVVIHDESLDRTTDGRGDVGELNLETVKRSDAGDKFAPAFRGERVPTLREVIDLVKANGNGRVRLDLELKYHQDRPGKPEDFEERVLEILRGTGFTQRVNVISFHHPSLAKVKALEPKIRTGLLAGGRTAPQDPVALVRQFRADYYSPSFRHVTSEAVAALHQTGIPIVPWTVNDETDMRRLMALGIGALAGDGIATDFPDRLLILLNARQRPKP